MKAAAVQRQLRQIALPEIGPAGQERLDQAVVCVAGGDLLAEIVARYLAAAGIGTLRLLGRGPTAGAPDRVSPDEAEAALDACLVASNPDLMVRRVAWPTSGDAWIEALGGADGVVRSGFDDDGMLPAAVRLGIPAVVARARDDRAELISFRKQGPCPHAPLDVPAPRPAEPRREGAAAVVAGTLAAAEVIHALLGNGGAARARHLALPLDGGEPRVQEIPWTPECFACGGSGSEMAFS